MEKSEDTHPEKNYSFDDEVAWRSSLNEGYLPFTNITPSITEKTQEELKKDAEIVLTEANILKTFVGTASPVFNKGMLVYNLKNDKWYKVLDLKTDEDYKPTWASLSLKDGSKMVELTKEAEFNDYTNTLTIFISVNKGSGTSDIIEVNPKIYDKFETALEGPFEGAGLSLMGYKIFYNGDEIDKETSLAKLEGIKNNDSLYASEGFGKPYKFNRFMKVYTSYGWSNSGTNCDAITFIPNQNIKVCGFSCFAARQKDSYEIKYKIRIDGNDVEENTVTATGWEDEHYYRHRLDGVYNAPANSKIEMMCWIAENIASRSYVETYYGEDGYDYEKVENEHMGLFKIES